MTDLGRATPSTLSGWATLYGKNFVFALLVNALFHVTEFQTFAGPGWFLLDTAVLAVLFVAVELVIELAFGDGRDGGQ